MNIILYVIIIILIYIITQFIPKTQTCEDLKIYKKILLSNLIHKIKEGDLVLFSSNRYNIISRTFGNDTFSHIGIVVKINNNFYIYEIVENDKMRPNTKSVSNVRFSPFSERIKNYNGNVYISSLINDLSKDQIYKLNKFTEKDFKFAKRWKMLFKLYSSKMSSNERFCSELVADVLNEIEVSDIPIKSKKYKLQSNIVKLCNDIIYYKPVHIIPDNLLVTNIRNVNNYINFCPPE